MLNLTASKPQATRGHGAGVVVVDTLEI